MNSEKKIQKHIDIRDEPKMKIKEKSDIQKLFLHEEFCVTLLAIVLKLMFKFTYIFTIRVQETII